MWSGVECEVELEWSGVKSGRESRVESTGEGGWVVEWSGVKWGGVE